MVPCRAEVSTRPQVHPLEFVAFDMFDRRFSSSWDGLMVQVCCVRASCFASAEALSESVSFNVGYSAFVHLLHLCAVPPV